MAQPASAEVSETAPLAGARPGADSIAEQVQARIEQLPVVPGDAMDWAALAALYEREARALGDDPAAARLLHEAGRIHEERLENPRGALADYRSAAAADGRFVPNLTSAWRMARALGEAALECELLSALAAEARDPRDAAALHLVRAHLLGDEPDRAEDARAALAAAAAADPSSLAVAEHEAVIAASEGRDEDLSRALERLGESAREPGLAAACLLAAAGVEEDRLGRSGRAADLALRAFDLAPADAAVRAAARRHAEREQRFDALALVLWAEGSDERVPARDAALALCALARLLDERLERTADADAALDRARERGGGDPVVLDALARLHEARGAWEATADALRARAAAVSTDDDPAELVLGQLRLAEICEERLGRLDEAAASYHTVLSIDPGHRGALAALGRLHARAGDWDRLLETFLAERAVATDPREQAHRCFKAAEVLEERLGRVPEAIELYAEALVLEPTLLPAHQALERLYERTGAHEELAALLESDLAATSDAEERVAVLFRLARLHEDRLGDLEAAAGACERILAIAPDHVVALRALAALRERAGRFGDLVALHDRLASLTCDPRKAIALLQRSAEVQEEQLADDAAAAATHERVLRLDPRHLPALRALGRLYARAGRWTDLVAMCRAEAEASFSTESAAALHFRVGEILEQRLGQEGEAIAAYREVLTLSPSHVGALRALARLYRARGEWESLVEVLTADAAARGAPDRKAALLGEAAEILETRLGDLDHAAEVHAEVLHAAPGSGPSLRALDRILSARGRWAELASLRRAQADHERGPARVASLLRAAALLADRAGDAAGAEEACRAALAEAPEHAGALILLSRVAKARAEAREALAARAAEPRDAAQLLVAAALDRAAEGGDGAADLARAAALAPADPVAGPLAEAALRRRGDHGALAELLATRRAAEPGAPARALWAQREGEAWEDAGDAGRARAAYEESLRLAPGALPALRGLRRVHARAGAWREVREQLQAEGGSLRDPALAAAAFAEAGELALSRLADPAGAAADWRRALERDPLDGALAERLADLLQESGSDAELCELREMRARAETVPERAADAWIAAARLAIERLSDRDRALADLDRALAARPASAPVLMLRGGLLAGAGRAADAARDLSACLALAGDPATAAPVHLELAALYEGPLRDPPRAMSHLNAVLAAAPEHAEALARLAQVHRDARNWPAAADALRRLVALPSLAPDALRRHLLELADVRAEGFGDAAAAIELFRRALELVPGDAAILERLARVEERAGQHVGVVSALEAVAAAAPAGAERARAYLRSARVLAGALGDPRRAVAELRRALEADPGSLEARIALADLYATTDPALAVEEHRRFLDEDPARLESWRALYRLFHDGRAHDRAFVVAGVLRFLQSSDPASDGAYYAQNALHAPSGTSQALAPTEWLSLRHPGDRGPLSEILSLTGDALAEVADLPPPPREKLKGAQPLASLIEELSANAGIAPFAVRPGGDGADLWIEPGDPPAVRAGADLARRHSVPEQRFLLARAAARLRARSGLAARLDASALADLMAAVVRQVEPGHEGLGRPSDALVRAVGRTLPRKIRKTLDEPVRALVRAAPQDVADWRAALGATADRVGLLLAADVPAALGLVLREGGAAAPGAAGVAAAVRASLDLRQLLCFAASEDHLRLRQRLRLAIA